MEQPQQIMACPAKIKKQPHRRMANNVFELSNKQQIIAYYNAEAGHPIKPTWLAAIQKGFLATWPLLTEQGVHKHFLELPEVAGGHMRHQRQGLRYTMPHSKDHHDQPKVKTEHGTYAQVYDMKNILPNQIQPR